MITGGLAFARIPMAGNLRQSQQQFVFHQIGDGQVGASGQQWFALAGQAGELGFGLGTYQRQTDRHPQRQPQWTQATLANQFDLGLQRALDEAQPLLVNPRRQCHTDRAVGMFEQSGQPRQRRQPQLAIQPPVLGGQLPGVDPVGKRWDLHKARNNIGMLDFCQNKARFRIIVQISNLFTTLPPCPKPCPMAVV